MSMKFWEIFFKHVLSIQSIQNFCDRFFQDILKVNCWTFMSLFFDSDNANAI
jgi:hypothetical protein